MTVATWPVCGAIDAVAEIVPAGRRNVTTCVNGVAGVVDVLASQMQNTNDPGALHVPVRRSVRLPLTVEPP